MISGNESDGQSIEISMDKWSEDCVSMGRQAKLHIRPTAAIVLPHLPLTLLRLYRSRCRTTNRLSVLPDPSLQGNLIDSIAKDRAAH